MKSCLASHLARKCSTGFLPSLRNQDLTQDCSRGPPSLARTPQPRRSDRSILPTESTDPDYICLTTRGRGRAAPETLASPVSVSRAKAGARGPVAKTRTGGRRAGERAAPRTVPLPGAPALRCGLRVPASTPPSRGAGRGGGCGRPAPNLSDPRSRPGAAGAACERCAPLPRGSGPSCASRPYRAGWGRDERRPRGSAPGRRAAPSRSLGVSKPALRPPTARGFRTCGL